MMDTFKSQQYWHNIQPGKQMTHLIAVPWPHWPVMMMTALINYIDSSSVVNCVDQSESGQPVMWISLQWIDTLKGPNYTTMSLLMSHCKPFQNVSLCDITSRAVWGTDQFQPTSWFSPPINTFQPVGHSHIVMSQRNSFWMLSFILTFFHSCRTWFNFKKGCHIRKVRGKISHTHSHAAQ